MENGSLSDQPIYELLCSFAAQRASGRLELTDGRRRRIYFFEGGKLSAAQSNIKSESTKHLQEAFPEASESQLLDLQGNLRVINAITFTEGEWQFLPNEVPPERQPIQLIAACWQGIQRKLKDEDIQGRLTGLDGRFPVLDWKNPITLKDLPLDQDIKSFLQELDGERSLEDVMDFAPGDAMSVSRALYLGIITGAVRLDQGSRSAEIRITRRDEKSPNSDLIAEAISSTRAEPVAEPVSPAASEPSPSEAQDLLGIASLIADEIGTDVAAPKVDGLDQPVSGDPEVRRLQETLAQMESAENFFDVLSIEWDASKEDYRNRYFELARTYHPDSAAGLPEEHTDLIHRIFTHISEAWNTLGDEEAKKAYIDRVVHGQLDENELATEKVRLILRAEDDFRTAVAHLGSGRIVQAHELLTTCVEQVPDEPEFRAYLGYTTFKLNKGRDDEAAAKGEESLRLAIEQVNKAPGAWVLMGKVYNETGHPDLARRCFVRALKIQPTNPEATLEMKRLKEAKAPQAAKGSFFKKLFSKKDAGK
ncbi:MAG: DnaJ domain-containing protein [Myxococcota bacterium]|nr:DnaJ domain-containing protein [Myxococcota bacterium]